MRIGIIGAGGIAVKMADTLKGLEDRDRARETFRQMVECGLEKGQEGDWLYFEKTAIAARDLDRARKFADEFGFKKAYGSYDELLCDPQIDLVYIAVPHAMHHEWTIKALKRGKHVLCEKAFALTQKEAEEMVEYSQKTGKLLAEAIWTRYMPSRKIINDIIDSGELGEIRSLSGNLGYPVYMNERMFRKELGGGALLDLSVYPINFSSMVHGNDIRNVSAFYIEDEHGVDGQDQITYVYRDGVMATMHTSMYTITDRTGWIHGSKGFLEVQNINNPEAVRLYEYTPAKNPSLKKEYKIPEQITGYEYELAACASAIEKGQIECPEMPHRETIEIMRQMDLIAKIWKPL